jgi:oligoribonuclease
MPADLNRLCWLDMEMSGLVPDSDRVLEIALLVTDSDLNHLSEGKVLVVHQPDSVLDAMDSWNKSVHGKSGLIERVRASDLDEAKAEAAALAFLAQFVSAAIPSARTAGSSRAGCRGSKRSSTTAISTSRR